MGEGGQTCSQTDVGCARGIRPSLLPLAQQKAGAVGALCGSGVFLLIPWETYVLKYIDCQKEKFYWDLLDKQILIDQPLFKLWIIFAGTSLLTSDRAIR